MTRMVCSLIVIVLVTAEIGFAQPPCRGGQCFKSPQPGNVVSAGQGARNRFAPEIQRATVLVRGYHRDGSRSVQTGVITATNGNTGLVITAAHLFRDEVTRVEVHPPDTHPRPYVAQVLTSGNPDHIDVAVLQFTAASPLFAIPLAEGDPAVGTSVVQVGYPGGQRTQAVRRGKIVRHEGTNRYQVMSFEVAPGDSGSVVFSGNRIAGLVWGSRAGDGAFAERPERIRQVLEAACRSGGCHWALRNSRSSGAKQSEPLGVTIQDLHAQLQHLREQIRELQHSPGPQGPAGKDGRDGDIKPQQVALYVREHLQKQPIHVQIVDPRGVVKQQTSVRLGGTLRLQLVPLGR